MSDLDPAAIDLSLRMPVGETLLGRHCNQLVCALIQRTVVSDERKQSRAERQPLVGEAEAEKGIPQIRLCKYVRVNSGMTDKRALGDWIIERKRLFQMRPRRSKHAAEHQVYPRGQVTQNEACDVVTLVAQMQQILVQALGQTQFATVRVITRLPIGYLNELRGRPQAFPQLARAGIGIARLWRPLPFDSSQHRAQ